MSARAGDQPGRGEFAQGVIEVDLGAVTHNVAALTRFVGAASVMAIVKADAYGHGMTGCAAAARAGGATWLGVATAREALRLREAGDTGPVLSWLAGPGADYAGAIDADVDVTAYTLEQLGDIVAAARQVARPARLHLKVDTGLGRGGASRHDWERLVEGTLAARRDGRVELIGVWSHFACSDWPDHPANALQETAFREALQRAAQLGAEPEVRHLSNSAATLLRPSAHFDLVRPGLACFGLNPAPSVPAERTTQLGLRPALRLRSAVALVKRLPAGESVSYGQTWVAPADTNIALVPIGYAEGIPRSAGPRLTPDGWVAAGAEVWVAGKRRPIRGVICMDQFVIDLGQDEVDPGAEVIVMGPGSHGEPTVQEWADWCETISYEIVTRLGGRLNRREVR